jgi:hypothetical protein
MLFASVLVKFHILFSVPFLRNPAAKESSLSVSTNPVLVATGPDSNSPFSPGLKSFKVTDGSHFDDLEDNNHNEESLATLLENHDHENEWKKEYLLLDAFKKRSFRKMKVY